MTEQQRKAMEMALKFIVVSSAKDKAWYTAEEFEVVAALREALAQPEQEPVAIVNEGMGGIEWLIKPLPDDTPLYTAPPKREWVGLTDEEVWELMCQNVLETDFARDIQAKLKEKNT